MTKRLSWAALLAALFICTGIAHAQVAVSGNLKDAGVSNVTANNTFVRFELKGFLQNIPKVTGSNIIARPVVDFKPDSSGNISGNIQGNDTINPTNTFYQMCIYDRGQSFRCAQYTITGSTFNLNSAVPITTSVPPSPVTQGFFLNYTMKCGLDPATPALGNDILYCLASDNNLYYIDSTGRRVGPLGTSGAGLTDPLDCSKYPGADVGAKWIACMAANPAGSVLTFKNFSSPQIMTTPVDVSQGFWNDMAGLQITQQANITVSTSAVIDKGEFDQDFSGDQFSVTASGVSLQNNTIIGDDGTHTGRGIVINAGVTNVTIDTNTIGFHSASEIQDDGGTSFAPNTIKNSRIFFDGVAGIRTTGGENISDTQFNWSGTGAGNAILQPSVAFYSLVRMDNVTFNGNQAAAMISAPNGADLIITNSQSTANGGYPAIDAPNGGLVQASWNSLQGGGANGPLIRYNTSIVAGSGLDISHNYNLSAIGGATVIEATLAQGAKIDGNDNITSDFSGKTGGCAVKIEAALGGSVSDNGISVVGYASFIGPNYGICYKTTAGQHNDNLYVHHNTITGQSSSGANSIGMIFDNSANVAPDFADGNTWDSNFCIDLGTCITRVSPSWNNSNTYSNNGGVALGKVYDTTGSTNDVVAGFGATFATLPVGGNGSSGYCSDCTTGTPTAGSGSGAFVVRAAGQWNGLGGAVTSMSWSGVTAGTNSNAGTFAMSGNTVDFHATLHALLAPRGLIAGLPATCSVGEEYFATDATAGQNKYYCTATNTWTQQLNSGAAGASTSLGNLATVGINTTLLPATINTVALGSNTLGFTNVFLCTVTNQCGSFNTANLTGNHVINIPNATSTPIRDTPAVANQFMTACAIATGICSQAQPTLADIAPGAAPAGTYDYSGVTILKQRFSAGLTTSTNGDFGYDTTNKNWHLWANAGDRIAALFASAPTGSKCLKSSVSSSVVTIAEAAADCGTTTPTSSETPTNKAFDAEGSGNSLGIPVKMLFPAAGCSNTTAGPSLDLGTTNLPTPICKGSTVRKGALAFAAGNVAYISTHLTKDWNSSSSVDLELSFTTTDTTNGHVTSFDIQTACNKVDGTATDDPSLNAVQALSVTTGASQVSGGQLAGTKTGLTMTGCVADYNLEIAIKRNNSGTDTNTDTAVNLKWAELTIGVTKNAANR